MGRKWRKFAAWLLALLLTVGIVSGCAEEGPAAGSYTEAENAKEAGGHTEDTAAAAEKAGAAENKSAGEEIQTESPAAEDPSDEGIGGASGAEEETAGPESLQVQEDGTYTSREEVALYLHLYGHLPDNYITKKEAEKLGWDSRAGNLDEVAPGMSIGGSRFGNYEKQLPEAKGRQYFECDIDFTGGYRGAKRIIYSNDGLIFYTEDHYETFEQLY